MISAEPNRQIAEGDRGGNTACVAVEKSTERLDVQTDLEER